MLTAIDERADWNRAGGVRFCAHFRRPMCRRKFLVLTGPTRLGKTIYGRGAFGHDILLFTDGAV